ncbi:hypothetical protein [Haliangium ochraceum]|uniref:Lipoprotein n=1 Tax=Haliangium ochraceum (strain DSM 14365 / JCM 11303 / SMP-2) TaxID=502025 RepID=D0LYY0_HALO1|nr:hypothetical protein [Haliangium ochraceum]ACY14450.1 hypothetical protein Hoch_1903 [Haliangium ochraceum DSM 14365]
MLKHPIFSILSAVSRRLPHLARPGLVALAAVLLIAAVAMPAHAGTVSGTVEFSPNRLPKPPERNQGFLARVENPLRPVKRFDPRETFIVVLEGGPTSEEDATPTQAAVRYELLGESFAAQTLPVLVGAQVELKNLGYDKPTLFSPNAPDVLDGVELASRGVHAIRVSTPYTPVVIRAENSPHLEGRVVAFPHRFFAQVDGRGRFEIADVPAGTWTAKVWYKSGWLKGVEQRIEVDGRRQSTTIEVSPVIDVVAP